MVQHPKQTNFGRDGEREIRQIPTAETQQCLPDAPNSHATDHIVQWRERLQAPTHEQTAIGAKRCFANVDSGV